MDERVENGLRRTFVAHFIVAGLFGLQHLIAPRVWTGLAGIEISETVTWRLIGAALVAFAVSSWLAYRTRKWAEVKILVVMEIVWCVLGAAVIGWGIMVEGLPPLEWLNAGLLVAFGVAFSVFWLRASSGESASAWRGDDRSNLRRRIREPPAPLRTLLSTPQQPPGEPRHEISSRTG